VTVKVGRITCSEEEMSHNSFSSPQNERRSNSSSVDTDTDLLVLHYLLYEKPIGTKFAKYCRGKELFLGERSKDPLRIQVNHRLSYLGDPRKLGPAELKRLYLLAKSQASEAAILLAQLPEDEPPATVRSRARQPATPPPTEPSPAFVSPSQPLSIMSSNRAAAPAALQPRVDNKNFQLDFDHPENNPYGISIYRDRNYSHNEGPHCDMVKIRRYFFDPRDFMYKEGRLTKSGGALACKSAKQPTFFNTNGEDLHDPGEDQFIQQHKAASGRLHASENSATDEITFHFPPSTTCRVTPFSVTNNVHVVYDENLNMDFGEQDDTGNPVLYGAYWIEYWLAINKPDEANKKPSEQMARLNRRFGNMRT